MYLYTSDSKNNKKDYRLDVDFQSPLLVMIKRYGRIYTYMNMDIYFTLIRCQMCLILMSILFAHHVFHLGIEYRYGTDIEYPKRIRLFHLTSKSLQSDG